MPAQLPYMLSPGQIPRTFEKIQQARRPERFTQDFLETKLGQRGGSARPIIPLLKRMGFLASDGTPTTLYDQFRNTESQGRAVAEGIRNAFPDLFERNEYAYDLTKERLASLVTEITGAAKNDRTSKAVVATFMALKDFADFEAEAAEPPKEPEKKPEPPIEAKKMVSVGEPKTAPMTVRKEDNVELRVGYTINLNLPETTDPDVFNAIFRALKEHLLKN